MLKVPLNSNQAIRFETLITAGRPRDGPIAAAMRKAKYQYKLLLRQKSCQSQLCFTNELHDALVIKTLHVLEIMECEIWP